MAEPFWTTKTILLVGGASVYFGVCNPFIPRAVKLARTISPVLVASKRFIPVAKLTASKLHVYVKPLKVSNLSPEAFELLRNVIQV